LLFRVFPFRPEAEAAEEGGAFYVARSFQGSGRHDNPDHYGALYAARSAESAVAEAIQAFRGQTITARDLRRADGRALALAALEDAGLPPLVDLDEPRELTRRRLRPSMIATRSRTTTRPIALGLFREGAPGLSWWSTLEASWTNVTLFAERCVDLLAVAGRPEALSPSHPALQAAAEALGVSLGR
jgi:RES domain